MSSSRKWTNSLILQRKPSEYVTNFQANYTIGLCPRQLYARSIGRAKMNKFAPCFLSLSSGAAEYREPFASTCFKKPSLLGRTLAPTLLPAFWQKKRHAFPAVETGFVSCRSHPSALPSGNSPHRFVGPGRYFLQIFRSSPEHNPFRPVLFSPEPLVLLYHKLRPVSNFSFQPLRLCIPCPTLPV